MAALDAELLLFVVELGRLLEAFSDPVLLELLKPTVIESVWFLNPGVAIPVENPDIMDAEPERRRVSEWDEFMPS